LLESGASLSIEDNKGLCADSYLGSFTARGKTPTETIAQENNKTYYQHISSLCLNHRHAHKKYKSYKK